LSVNLKLFPQNASTYSIILRTWLYGSEFFCDHIIRDEKDYFSISEYIVHNLLAWEKDNDFVVISC